ncbi:MAG: hypothetical protein AAGA65_09475 [Actinomycetota bacterium]
METAWEDGPISFGDNVMVRATDATEAVGLALLRGQVFGQTVPSASGVDVVGDSGADYAINVHFEQLDRSVWFAPDCLELVNHGAGTTIAIDGVDKQWTRTEDGGWLEEGGRKPWWKFW